MLGMFLGVPVCAVVYMLFKDFIEGRLRKRQLPQKTSDYARDVGYITPDYVCDEPEEVPAPELENKHSFKDVVTNRVQLCKEKLHIKDKKK